MSNSPEESQNGRVPDEDQMPDTPLAEQPEEAPRQTGILHIIDVPLEPEAPAEPRPTNMAQLYAARRARILRLGEADYNERWARAMRLFHWLKRHTIGDDPLSTPFG